MAPRKKNASIKSSGTTSSKAEPLPDWVKNKNVAKPPPKYAQQQQQPKQAAGPSKGANGATLPQLDGSKGTEALVRPPPLFPPGTKTPINLLNERIQKHHAPKGWLKPNIDARRAPKGYGQANGGEGEPEVVHEGGEERWTFVVTLTKTNKSDQSNPFTVRMDARDPSGCEGSTVVLDSKEKAKHWGATYALFRLCSNLSLDQILPTGPREYWKSLDAHKKQAPEHLAWLWSADPFEAMQKMQSDKEASRVAREKRAQELHEHGPRLPRQWLEAREVRMAKELRDLVESTVREALHVYPMDDEKETNDLQSLASASGASTPTGEDRQGENDKLAARLTNLGFRPGYAKSAVRWLSLARQDRSKVLPSAASSLSSIRALSDEDACLEYLTIFCPEDDLPARFAPSRKADSFVTSSASASAGDALAERWIEERLVKSAGFPRPAVESVLQALGKDVKIEWKESACIDLLLRRLGLISTDAIMNTIKSGNISKSVEVQQARADERMALEAVLGPERILEIPTSERPLVDTQHVSSSDLFDIVIAKKPEDDIRLRICTGATSDYPAPDSSAMPTFVVVSDTLPAYLRLALTQRLIRCLTGQLRGFDDWKEMLAAGQGGVLLAMVEELESSWKQLADDPPELADVMAGVTISAKVAKSGETGQTSPMATELKRGDRKAKTQKTTRPLKDDGQVNEHLKSLQTSVKQSEAYAPINAARARLPASASADEILALLQEHRLLIIAGETGCGKTTQCPQFVLDRMIESGQGSLCNVIVTQPRRLSAMGVAARVASERCETLDGSGLVGYAIRGEHKSGRNTRLLFTTTGVLLRRLSTNDPDLLGVSHVFVDEVHERGVDSDLLLLELRQVLQRNATLRVILMSATIERETFTTYFPNTPTLDIPGRTFPVTDHYLEDIREMLGKANEEVDSEELGGHKGRQTAFRESIDYQLLGQTVELICQRAQRDSEKDGGILVFLPGVGEIRRAIEAIERTISRPADVLPLHANLSPDEQRRVFQKPKGGRRKVICSTNVAETSITIDDIVYVIDTGLVKETRYDPQSGLTKLVETRCSQANARQRRGRAGRVRPGECYRLYTRATERVRMEAQQMPEMMRMSLENLVLSVKALKGDTVSVEQYLGSAISPPSMEAIGNAVRLLGDMNILLDGQRLTAMGKHISLLPLDVRLAKMMVYGCVFRCLGPLLTAAAVLSSKPLFSAPFEKREEASKARARFASGQSDILTDVCAFDEWTKLRKSGEGNAAVRRWCDENFVSASSLRDIVSVRSDLLGSLVEMGFVPMRYRADSQHAAASSTSVMDVNAGDVNLQRALILAALYPSVVRIVQPQAKYDKAIGGTVEREAEARQVRYVDNQRQRVFLHPSSVLFSSTKYGSDFLASFRRGASSQQQKGQSGKGGEGGMGGDKIFLRDATEVPTYALLLFGGQLRIHRREGGISMGGSGGDDDGSHSSSEKADTQQGWIKFRANGRIAALINQLRFLLDAAMARSFDDPTDDVFSDGIEARVRDCLHAILRRDGQ